MIDEPTTTADLLAVWRDATRASELADRLAKIALEAVEGADRNAVESEELAVMAERAAEAAQRAAETARAVAQRASAYAAETRGARLHEADQEASEAHAAADRASERYQRAEKDALERHSGDGSRT